ncbi:MAG: HdeD family acid-resistance protein [Pseudoramibacter sp.]
MFSKHKDTRKFGFLEKLYGHWWMMLIEGILMIVLGALIAVIPGFRTLTVIIRLVGLERLIIGFFYLILSLRDSVSGFIISSQALVNLIIGFFLALMPGFFLSFFIFLLALWAFIAGIGMLINNRGDDHLSSRTIVGVLLIVFGVLAAVNPHQTAQIIVLIFAVMLIVFGGYLLNRSAAMHQTEKQIEKDRKGYDDYTIE